MPEPTVVKTISRSGGYEAVYLQHEDGTVTRDVRRVGAVEEPQPAPKRKRTRKAKEADQ